MSKYDIQDAYKLKAIMQEVTSLIAKYPVLDMYLDSIPENIKEAIEFIDEMVKKETIQ